MKIHYFNMYRRLMIRLLLLIKSVIVLLIVLALINSSYGAALKGDVQVVTVKNFQKDFLIYEKSVENYLPYIQNSPLQFPTLNYHLNLRLYSGYQLLNCIPGGSSIFIDQKIVDFAETSACLKMNIDSLRQVYHKDTLFITIYNPTLEAKNVEASVITERISHPEPVHNATGIISIIPRQFSSFSDFFVIGIILIMILIAILYNGNMKYFYEFYNFPKAVSLKIREESYISVKHISGSYLFFLVVHSLIVGFVILSIIHFYDKFRDLTYFVSTTSFLSTASSWLQLSLIVFTLLLSKYILVKAVSQLFNIKGFSSIHFFDFVRMSISFFLLVLIALCVLLFAFNFEDPIWFQPLVNIIIIFFVLRVVILFLKLYKYAPFRNLHLFLYICSTELLPLLIGFKILIND